MARARIRLARFTVASAIATGLSQVVLLMVYSWTDLDALSASTIAFLAGSVPHFLMVRYWAWPPGNLHSQLATYLTVTLLGGVGSIGLTTAAEWLVLPFLPAGWQPLALTLSYLAASGPVFVAKFAIFDRVFAARRARAITSEGMLQPAYAPATG
ncbi:GtrA family protein [Actinophytocola sp.]|uniref:GtrA family protein n=1 Tax=Actinophytocola sp. TaxID=1872138 RepID=UPI002ED46A36